MRHARLERRALVAGILARRGDAAVVAGLGSAAWDCHAAGDSPLNFYFWGAMGGAAMLGLGVALARPDRRVLVVTGDAEMLMGMGSLAAIAAQAPSNLALLVLDNEAFGETGRQAGLTGKNTDIAAIARGAGIETAFTVGDEGGEGSSGTDVEGDDPGGDPVRGGRPGALRRESRAQLRAGLISAAGRGPAPDPFPGRARGRLSAGAPVRPSGCRRGRSRRPAGCAPLPRRASSSAWRRPP